MIKKNLIKESSDLIGKKVSLEITGKDSFECFIDVMEEDGLIVHYYTEEGDITNLLEEDDDDAVLTTSYYPWSSVIEIVYREDESY